jgi:hypothetical protein
MFVVLDSQDFWSAFTPKVGKLGQDLLAPTKAESGVHLSFHFFPPDRHQYSSMPFLNSLTILGEFL